MQDSLGTAHAATASTVVIECRTPRRMRGSRTCANAASTPVPAKLFDSAAVAR